MFVGHHDPTDMGAPCGRPFFIVRAIDLCYACEAMKYLNSFIFCILFFGLPSCDLGTDDYSIDREWCNNQWMCHNQTNIIQCEKSRQSFIDECEAEYIELMECEINNFQTNCMEEYMCENQKYEYEFCSQTLIGNQYE